MQLTQERRAVHWPEKNYPLYAPDRWIRELNRRYPNIWIDLRKGFNEPKIVLGRQPKALEILGKVPDWCIMPTFFPGMILMQRYGETCLPPPLTEESMIYGQNATG